MGELVRISRPFGMPSLRGEIGRITSRPRPCVINDDLFEQYAVELHDKVIWINTSALDHFNYKEVKKCGTS